MPKSRPVYTFWRYTKLTSSVPKRGTETMLLELVLMGQALTSQTSNPLCSYAEMRSPRYTRSIAPCNPASSLIK